MNRVRVARILIPLAVLCALGWLSGGWATTLVLAGLMAAMCGLLVYRRRADPHSEPVSLGEIEALASYCSPQAILRSGSAGQAIGRTVMLGLFWPTLLLMPLLRRLLLRATETGANQPDA